MTFAAHEIEAMTTKGADSEGKPMGPLLARNLYRLGFADVVVRSAEIARRVESKTGKSMSRQRISALMNAVVVDAAMVETIAKSIGVKPSELLKDVTIEVK